MDGTEGRQGICSRCGGAVAPEADVCPHCGAALRAIEDVLPPVQASEPGTAEDGAAETSVAPEKGGRRRTRKIKALIAAAAAAVVALTSVTAVLVWHNRQNVYAPLLFYKGQTLYAVSPANWNRIIALEAENGGTYLDSAYIQYSSDGRYLYYPDRDGIDSYVLYSCDLLRGTIRKVSDEVDGLYRLTPNGRTAVYSRSGALLCSDPDGTRTLAQDVQKFMLANDGSGVIYQTGEGRLYRIGLSSGESIGIGAADEVCCISPAADSAYYIRDNTLYYWKRGRQEKALRDAGYGVSMVDFGEEEAYLLVHQVPVDARPVIETEEEIYEEPRQRLYYCRNGEIQLLAEDVRQFQMVSGAHETPRLLYRVQKAGDDAGVWYYADRTACSLITQEAEIGSACLSDDGGELWFIAGEVIPPPATSSFWGLQTGTLRAAQLRGGKVGAIRAVDDRAMMLYARSKGEPLYMRDDSQTQAGGMRLTGELCGGGEMIAEEVQLYGVMPEPGTEAVYFSLRADENDGFSVLAKWDGHAASVICDQTARTELLGRDRVAVMRRSEQILTVYDRGKAIELARGVSAFAVAQPAETCASWW